MTTLKPFWNYYGGKWRAALHYPVPCYPVIVEPFAGAAGYALRYADRNVVLVERYPVIAEMWRYLCSVRSDEIRRIPPVEHVDELPAWVPPGGKSLVGFCMNTAVASPRKSLSSGLKKLTAKGRKFAGWTTARRDRVARQVRSIRHWKSIEGDYTQAPYIEATWFVDPPYNNKAGAHYVHGPSKIDYNSLGTWCKMRAGQTIVCENDGADWLPFELFGKLKSGPARRVSDEVVWVQP